VVPPGFDPEKEGIDQSLPDFDPPLSFGKKPDGLYPFKGQVSFIAESARIMKSSRPGELALKSKMISEMKGIAFFFEEEEKVPFHRDMAIGQNHLMRFDRQLCSIRGAVRGLLDCPFDQDGAMSDET